MHFKDIITKCSHSGLEGLNYQILDTSNFKMCSFLFGKKSEQSNIISMRRQVEKKEDTFLIMLRNSSRINLIQHLGWKVVLFGEISESSLHYKQRSGCWTP